jgi:hypothetical protein
MRNTVRFYLGLFFLLIVSLSSCKKSNQEGGGQGNLQVNFSLNSLKNTQIDTSSATTLSEIVVTIEDINGKVVKSEENIELYNKNGNYISKLLALPAGKYKLAGFLVLDWKNNVVYASPVKGSSKAYLVQNPLPLEFNISKDNVTKIAPEVINVASCKPEDFGYTNFTLNIANTFDFKVGVFIYDDSIKNFKITSSSISVYSDTLGIYNIDLNSKTNGSLVNFYDSLGITNSIALPEKYNYYTLKIMKSGYKTYIHQFSKEELKLHFRSVDKGPLVVILEKDQTLVAYYKFKRDVKDYSGFNNNGTYYGSGLYSSGYNSEASSAIDLNGFSDYVAVKSSASLRFTNQITLCGWYYSVPFYGNGQNVIIATFANGDASQPSFLLGARGSYYQSSSFSFCITTNQKQQQINTVGPEFNFTLKRILNYDLYKWYFIAGTYDGTTEKLYVNGELLAWGLNNGSMVVSNDDIYMGLSPQIRPSYDFLKGKLDEIRVYNRALSESEILYLYQH